MKRIWFAIVAIVVLFAFSASAESVDISGFSFDELVALREKLNLAMWESNEWQSVDVPQGVWQVGVDIPAGTWTIKCTDMTEGHTYITVGDKVTSGGTEVERHTGKDYTSDFIINPDYYEKKQKEPIWNKVQFVATLNEGEYVEIKYAPATFCTYTGKQDLDFKF